MLTQRTGQSNDCPVSFLHFCHPKAMDIAVFVDGNDRIIAQTERSFGIIPRLQIVSHSPVFGLDVNPLDIVLRLHGMPLFSHTYGHHSIQTVNYGDVLFFACLCGIGFQQFHSSSAAIQGNPAIFDQFDQIAAMSADIKFYFLHGKPAFPLVLDRSIPRNGCNYDFRNEEKICKSSKLWIY